MFARLEYALQDAIKAYWKKAPTNPTCEDLCKFVKTFFDDGAGKWIYQRMERTLNNNILNVYECSHCKYEQYVEKEIHFNYCPVCGVKMVSERRLR